MFSKKILAVIVAAGLFIGAGLTACEMERTPAADAVTTHKSKPGAKYKSDREVCQIIADKYPAGVKATRDEYNALIKMTGPESLLRRNLIDIRDLPSRDLDINHPDAGKLFALIATCSAAGVKFPITITPTNP